MLNKVMLDNEEDFAHGELKKNMLFVEKNINLEDLKNKKKHNPRSEIMSKFVM